MNPDLFDLEADMHAATEWDAKVQRARERVAAFQAPPIPAQLEYLNRPCDGTCHIPELRRIALRNI